MSAKEALVKKLGGLEAYRAYLRELGSRGGKKSKPPADHPTRFDNAPELASRAGRIGGLKSRRKPLDFYKRQA